MATRKPISDSIRWAIFARDGFCCRYCGRQAGQDGISLVIDHVVSVADGGDNRIDNLATACQSCNAGKSAKSLLSIPSSEQVLGRLKQNQLRAEAMRDEMDAAIASEKDARQGIVNMKCEAYGVEETSLQKGEVTAAMNLCSEFGAAKVYEWYQSACVRGVSKWQAIKYVCGCARRTREEAGQ